VGVVTGAELEAAVADSGGGLVGAKKKPFNHRGEPCKNCGTSLEGWYCYNCGQNADTHHRSILHLIWEAIEGMFHLDGRLANTLPLLFFRPGKLAKDYMEGRIVRHVPPFRTFLVALLLFIFAAEHAIHGIRHQQELKEEKEAAQLSTPQGRKAKADEIRKEAAADRQERLQNAVAERDEDLKDADADKAKVAAEYADDVKKAERRYAEKIAEADALEKNPNAGAEALDRLHNRNSHVASQVRGLDFETADKLQLSAESVAEERTTNSNLNIVTSPEPEAAAHGEKGQGDGRHAAKAGAHWAGDWFKERVAKAIENPDYYTLVLFGWAHRLAVLLLPIIGLSLALVYVNKRQYFIYDHLLVATNLLSFSFLTNALGMVLPHAAQGGYFGLLALWTPINLFQTLRGGYGSSVVGAVFKTMIVWLISVTSFGVLLGALMLFTLSQI
jgi:hypothetical protein